MMQASPYPLMHPRETMRRLPACLQPLLTWVTGVPLSSATPRWRWTPAQAALLGAVQMACGLALGMLALRQAVPARCAVLLLSWLTTAGGMRRLDVVVIHQSLHDMVSPRRWVNRAVGEALSVLLLRMPYDGNRREHLLHHAYPCSLRDGDTLYLRGTGMRPGMTRQAFHRYLLRALLSPAHHGRFLWSRARANLSLRQPLYRQAMVAAYWGALALALTRCGLWPAWLALWAPALTFFFQSATFLYTHTEHRWWLHGHRERLQRHERDALSFARLCGDPAPARGLPLSRALAQWGVWWARLLLLHAPYRLFILVGDTVQHDLHHVRPRCDWANSAHERRLDIEGGSPRYNEVWGTLADHLHAAGSVQSARRASRSVSQTESRGQSRGQSMVAP